jgi:transposase
MGRSKEAPYGFQCPYRDACPHLGGISTKWANSLISDARRDTFRDQHYVGLAAEEISALQADNQRLEKENAELRARLKAQHSSRFKPNCQPARDPKRRRKRGAPRGHPPWNRPVPDRIDRTLRVPAPTICPHCAAIGLQPTGETHEQIQEDIIIQPETIVTAYQHDTALCPKCRRPVFQTAEGELRNCQIGPNAKAAAVFLRHEFRLSYRNVRKILSQLFGLSFVPASAMAFDQATARAAEPIHEQLRDKVRAADTIHADETHWRIDGQGAYIWFAGNPNFGFFHIDRSRSGEVALEIFGPRFQGSLVADDYAAYNLIEPKNRQSCLAHLIRKAKEIAQTIRLLPEHLQYPSDLHFCEKTHALFSRACEIGRFRDTGQLSFTQAKAERPALHDSLHRICKAPCHHPEAENLRQRLLDPKRDHDRLFTFLQINRMPPTNNYAEQTLRHPVIFRKLIFGNRSEHGAHALAVNLSLIHTAKCAQREIIPLLKIILLSGHETAAALLFENSS